MKDFQYLQSNELDALDDQGIVDYIAGAREAGHPDWGLEAGGVLAFRNWPRVVAWVKLRTPPDHVEDVAMEVMTSAMRSTFDGKAIGQFVSFLKMITQRRIADFHERRPPLQDRLPGEHGGEETVWGQEPSVDDESAAIEVLAAVDEVLATRSELHRRVIRLRGAGPPGFDDLTSREVVARIDSELGERISEGNVDQIWSRFKKDLDAALREDAGAAHD